MKPSPQRESGHLVYACPMHAEIRQDTPGKCSGCGMDLTPQEESKKAGGEEMQEPMAMMREHHEKHLWTSFANLVLGLWLIAGALSSDYGSRAMFLSDIISGTLVLIFGSISLSVRRDMARWGVCFVGIWLLAAPLIFWAPHAVSYVNDTLVGALLIAFSVLVPMMPGMGHHMAMMAPGPDIPPGWTYNPSSWQQRVPMIALAFLGFFVSRYLAAYQLGYIPYAWDPFFGESTMKVLKSDVSKMWPISDGGLGAMSYMLEALSGFMGGKSRWRTMPWMVLMFFLLVVPLGITHIILVVSQPILVGNWCTLCLLAAAIMLLMIPFAVDEVFAMFQFMAYAKKSGKPFWRTFWTGGTIEEVKTEDIRTPPFTSAPKRLLPSMAWGISLPQGLIWSMLAGLWIMVSPAFLGISGGTAANNSHFTGALMVTIAVISTAEVIRSFRFLNIFLGAWMIASAYLIQGVEGPAQWNSVAGGIILVLLSIPRGRIKEHYQNWDRYVV